MRTAILARLSLTIALGLTACPGNPTPWTSDSGKREAGGPGWPDGRIADVRRATDGPAPSDRPAGTEAKPVVDKSPPPSPDLPPPDPCPNLTIPAQCFGRDVLYREWGPSAVGDGTYFVDQAPYRLGFTRYGGRVWIVKFKTEDNNYRGRISAYGDSKGGAAWISDKPCDPTFAFASKLAAWSGAGGGDLSFVVARNETDAQALKAAYPADPQLLGGHCYYIVFENTDYPSAGLDANFLNTATDPCSPDCWYLAFDFNHFLHNLDGQTVAGNVLPGFTIGP